MTSASGRVRDRVVLLRRSVHGDADLIVTFLGKRLGKVTAFARSARRSKKRFGGSLSWFTVADVEMSRRPNAEMFTLASADTVRANTELAIDPATLSHASYATELVRELLVPEHSENGVFEYLCAYYAALRRDGASRFGLRSFELMLLAALGMAPSFESCARCGSSDLERGAVLESHGGGVACRECAAGLRGQGTRPLENDVRLYLADAASQPDIAKAVSRGAENSFDAAIELAAQQATTAILSRYLSRPLRSLEFIAKMNAAP